MRLLMELLPWILLGAASPFLIGIVVALGMHLIAKPAMHLFLFGVGVGIRILTATGLFIVQPTGDAANEQKRPT